MLAIRNGLMALREGTSGAVLGDEPVQVRLVGQRQPGQGDPGGAHVIDRVCRRGS